MGGSDKPTARQQQVLDFLRERIQRDGIAPTLREIAAHMGVKSTNGVTDWLDALARKGKIIRRRGWRGISVVGCAPPCTDPLRAGILAEVQRLEALGPEAVAKIELHEAGFGAQSRSSLGVLRRLGGLR